MNIWLRDTQVQPLFALVKLIKWAAKAFQKHLLKHCFLLKSLLISYINAFFILYITFFTFAHHLITMESNEHPSVPVTSEVVSNNYAQQKTEALCKEVKDLKQKNIEQDQELQIFRAKQKTSMNDCRPRRSILGKIVYSLWILLLTRALVKIWHTTH